MKIRKKLAQKQTTQKKTLYLSFPLLQLISPELVTGRLRRIPLAPFLQGKGVAHTIAETGVTVRTRILTAIVFALLGAGLTAPAFGQLVADPNDRLYTDLEMWMDRGLTQRLPPLRPYPVQLVKKTLTDVQSRGTEADKELAAWYLSKIDGGPNFHGIATALARTNMTNGFVQGSLEGSLQGSVYPWLTYSAKLGVVGLSSLAYSYLLPEYQRTGLDYVSDNSVKSVAGLYPRMTMIGGGTIGTDAIYGQLGVLRGSYGPFWGDNAVLSPTSPQSGQFSFVFHDNAMSGTMLLMDISATDPSGGNLSPEKFLTIGGLEFYPFDWLTLGVFDAMVWGQRFDPLYVLPVVSFYAQGMAGYVDNSFIGVSGGIRLPGALKADLLLYVDDAAFNDLIRLNFNTMLLAALQIGLSWTPNLPYLTRLRVTNLLITPYTYSHSSYSVSDPANFLNYTNAGQNIGPSIQPDSDRIEVEALLRPVDWVDLNLFGRFIVHGNATLGPNSDFSPNDGTVWDTGATEGYRTLRFLTQSVLEKVLQTGFDAAAYLETPVGEVKLSLSYTFEWVMDGNADTGPVAGNNAINNYLGVGVQLTY